MGFEAKVLFVLQRTDKADRNGPRGETTCTVWEDSYLGIDFDHITRLEKVVSQRFAHVTHTPFRRAGICVVDCFMTNLFTGMEEKVKERFAPEILVPKPFFFEEDPSEPTEKIGEQVYLDCLENRLKGSMGNEDLIQRHNAVVRLEPSAILAHLDSGRWSIIYPPLLWASCADMARWLTQAEETQTEGWKAIIKDRVSLAIVLGWRHQLRELGEVGARAVFRIS